MTSTIDDTLRDLAGAEPGEDTERGPAEGPELDDFSGDEDEVNDPVLGLQEDLTLVLPGHTHFKLLASSQGPRGLLIGPGGQRIEIPRRPAAVRARWSTPQGMWRVTAAPCEPDLLHYSIKGPNTRIARDHRTTEQLIEQLRQVEAISA